MKEKILELRKSGKSYNEISQILGCAKSTVSYHCSKMDVNDVLISKLSKIKNLDQRKDKFLIPDNDLVKKIYELKILKKSYKEISTELGVTFDRVSKICRGLGLNSYRRFGGLSDSEISEIRNLYSELKSIKKVAKIIGLDRSTVSKYVQVIKADKLPIGQLKRNSSRSVISWRKRKKLELVEYKGGCCQVCGYNKSVRALEFHHVDPNEKDFTISGKSWSFDRLKNEVDKCVLVCANCHIEIHDGLVKLN